jgi:hypothetical protein
MAVRAATKPARDPAADLAFLTRALKAPTLRDRVIEIGLVPSEKASAQASDHGTPMQQAPTDRVQSARYSTYSAQREPSAISLHLAVQAWSNALTLAEDARSPDSAAVATDRPPGANARPST